MTKRVVVIGAGAIGAATALELQRRGCQVTLIDRGRLGYGCSYGNAGWLTPCFATPLPAPGLMRSALRWMFDPSSPLYIKPAPRLALASWLLRFTRAMNRRQFAAGSHALVELAQKSMEWFREFAATAETGDIGFDASGLLLACESEAGLRAAEDEMEVAARHGIPCQPLSADALRVNEPGLANDLRGGAYFPNEAYVEPLRLVEAIGRAFVRAGGELRIPCELFDFEIARGRVRKVLTTAGPLDAEAFVLATGSWSRALGRRARLDLPVLGGKGYGLIVPRLDPPLRRPLYLLERKIAVTPRSDSMRLAGTLELVDGDESISPRRVAAIRAGAQRFLPALKGGTPIELWRGLRPCTPDGLPIIGFPHSLDNLLIATGHQMLGIYTSPATAQLAADLVLGTVPRFDPAPFRATRF